MVSLAKISIRRPKEALAGYLVLGIVLAAIGFGISNSLSPSLTVVPGTGSARAQQLAEAQFGPSQLVPILLEGPKAQLNKQGPTLVKKLASRRYTRVLSAWDAGPGAAQLRPRPTAAMIVVSVDRSEANVVRHDQPQIETLVSRTVKAPVKSYITGQPSLDRAVNSASLDNLRTTELIAVGILFALLLIGLRAPVAAGVVTAVGAVSTLAAFGEVALLGHLIKVDSVAVALGSMTGLALGVALALLILDRFHREKTDNHLAAANAAAAELRSTGRAVLVGGTAVVVALALVAIIGPTQLMVSLGTGMLTCALFAIGGAVVVMPAALVLLGRRLDAFSFPAPAPLARAWSRIVDGGNWVTRNAAFTGFAATLMLAALAVPTFALSSGPQTISQLPKGSKARTAFEEISRVMGPGWATPYNIIVVARNQPITTPSVLKSMQQLELQIARNRSVSSVTGPGAINVTAKQLASFGPQLNHSAAVSEQSKKDLLTLINGLGLAGSGSAQLQSGLAAAASGASQLHAGGGAAHTGAGQLHSGLSQAQAGSEQLKAGLDQALTGATALKSGASQALSGATQLASGLGKGSPQVTAGLPAVGQLASSSGAAASQITSLKGQAQNAQSAASQALSTLRGMTTGKNDPNYQAALSQLSAANGALNSVIGGLGSAASDANSAAFIAAGVKSQVETLAPQLTAAASGASQLQAGIAQLRDGNAQLATGLGQLSNGGGQLNSGLGQLTAGAGQLEDGLSQLTTGAAQLASGLSGGIGPAGQLTLGLGTMQAAVTKARGQIPSTAQLRQLQQQSPGLFSSGYFVLAAVHGAPPAQRTAASFTVNLLRGGTAGQIVVVSKYDANDPRTVALGDTLGIQVNAWTKKTGGVQAAIGGPAGSLGDITSVADSRIWLDVGVIAVAIALVLAIALRAVLLPAVATILSLLVTAATFGLLQVLFGGSDPVLGGPGHITPMTIIGIFAVAFGVTVAFATLMLMRTREALTAGANTSRAVRIALRETAAAATGAGLVMVASLIPFATTRLIDVREFGTGVAIAVLLDILILRPVLLPAAEAVLGRYGWWPTSTSGPERPVHDTAHRRRRPHLGQRKAKVVHQ